MCEFNFKIEIPTVGPQTEEELEQRVPDALCVLVIDIKGNITPLRTSRAETQTLVGEHHFQSPIKSIDSPPATISVISVTENPRKCVWMVMNGTPVCFR